MEKLKGMVGAKNEEFRSCQLMQEYVSVEQTRGRIFVLKTPNIKDLREELINEITLDQFVNKYGKKVKRDNCICLQKPITLIIGKKRLLELENIPMATGWRYWNRIGKILTLRVGHGTFQKKTM